ncbi:MAG: TIGR04283 family arsenosugar biosynthesis glycosyltransferase [Marinobacter sp.]|nr:TIGR04283 family arsenosugar biosynthesis glycosyltransferase [Marinobacter sp.]
MIPSAVPVSIIMPVLNEAACLQDYLSPLQALRTQGWELIVTDGGSDDGSVQLAQPLCDRVVSAPRGRARQMNAGAAVASGEVLLFLHADTQLPDSASAAMQAFIHSAAIWGRFDVRLSGQRPLFRVIAWFINQRSRLTAVATGDQALFVRRSTFVELGGFADIPLMEDVELCKRLRALGCPFCVRSPVVTDSRRWERMGAWRTILLMWRLRWRYWRGESPAALAQAYRTYVRRHD